MAYYPVLADLTHLSCLVVGAGHVGCRKLEGLLRARPRKVTVIDPAPGSMVQPFMDDERVSLEQRCFKDEDVAGHSLVFAATNDHTVNTRIAALCRDQGILCSVADAPQNGSCILPAVIRRGNLVVSVSTSGDSPALAKRIKAELEALLDERYEKHMLLLQKLRIVLLETEYGDQAERADIFRSAAAPRLGESLNDGDRKTSEILLGEALPASLHRYIPELLHGLV